MLSVRPSDFDMYYSTRYFTVYDSLHTLVLNPFQIGLKLNGVCGGLYLSDDYDVFHNLGNRIPHLILTF